MIDPKPTHFYDRIMVAAAEEFLAKLRTRGAWLELHDDRLVLKPAHVYGELSDGEQAQWRECRQQLKDAVRAGRSVRPQELSCDVPRRSCD